MYLGDGKVFYIKTSREVVDLDLLSSSLYLLYGIIVLPYFLVQDLSSLTLRPSPQSVNFTFLVCPPRSFPVCSQYCHLLALPPTLPVSPFPIHFVYFQGKTPLRNLQRLLPVEECLNTQSLARLSRTLHPSPIAPSSCLWFSQSALLCLLLPSASSLPPL